MILGHQRETGVCEKGLASSCRLEIASVDRDKDTKVPMVLVRNRLKCLVDMIYTTKCGHTYENTLLRHVVNAVGGYCRTFA